LGRVASVIANVAFLIVAARSLGPQEFGALAAILAFAAIVGAFCELGSTAVLAREFARADPACRAPTLGAFLWIRCVLAVASVAGATFAVKAVPASVQLPAMVLAVAAPLASARFFEPIYQVCGRPWRSLVPNVGLAATLLLLSWFVVGRRDTGLLAIAVALAACHATYVILAWTAAARLVRPDFVSGRARIRAMLSLAAPIGTGAVFTTIATRVDVMMLAWLRGVEEAGIYSAATRIVEFGTFLAVTVIAPWLPLIAARIAVDRVGAMCSARAAVRLTALATTPLLYLVPHLAPELIELVFGDRFAEAAVPLAILAPSLLLVALSLTVSTISLADGVVRHAYWNAALGAAVNVALNALWIPTHGAVGSAWASLASQASMLAVAQGYLHRRFGNVHEVRAWLLIGVANVAAWSLLQATFVLGLGRIPAALVAVGAYIAMILSMRLVPRRCVVPSDPFRGVS
jgi:O-antigen/teichoic acid export membrane protein